MGVIVRGFLVLLVVSRLFVLGFLLAGSGCLHLGIVALWGVGPGLMKSFIDFYLGGVCSWFLVQCSIDVRLVACACWSFFMGTFMGGWAYSIDPGVCLRLGLGCGYCAQSH